MVDWDWYSPTPKKATVRTSTSYLCTNSDCISYNTEAKFCPLTECSINAPSCYTCGVRFVQAEGDSCDYCSTTKLYCLVCNKSSSDISHDGLCTRCEKITAVVGFGEHCIQCNGEKPNNQALCQRCLAAKKAGCCWDCGVLFDNKALKNTSKRESVDGLCKDCRDSASILVSTCGSCGKKIKYATTDEGEYCNDCDRAIRAGECTMCNTKFASERDVLVDNWCRECDGIYSKLEIEWSENNFSEENN